MFRVLYIENEEYEFISEALSLEGYIVDVATSSKNAIEKLSSNQYDLVLLDIMMAHENEISNSVPARRTGISILSMIRNGEISNTPKDIPVFIITGLGSSLEIDDIRKLNIVCIIQKPIIPDTVALRITEEMTRFQDNQR